MENCIAPELDLEENVDIEDIADILISEAASILTDLDNVYLNHCEEAEQEHRESSRQYMHVGTHTPCYAICYAQAVNELSIGYKVGLLVHELGHLALIMLGYEDHSEDQANAAGLWLTDIPVFWRGKEKLEWSPIPQWLFDELAESA